MLHMEVELWWNLMYLKGVVTSLLRTFHPEWIV